MPQFPNYLESAKLHIMAMANQIVAGTFLTILILSVDYVFDVGYTDNSVSAYFMVRRRLFGNDFKNFTSYESL